MQLNPKLYEVIINYLEKQITDGAYDNNVRLPTEAALAKMFNVSRITAQRALDELELKGLIYRRQGSGSYISENNAKTIFNMPESDTFSDTVSLILPYDVLGGRFSEIVRSAAEILETRGYHLVLYNSRSDAQSEREILFRLMKTDTSGIIFYPNKDRTNMDLLYQLWLKKFPFIAIDKKIPDISICSVYSDNYKGSYDLTKKLIESGHTKIACFYYMELADVFSIRQRFFGYCAALNDSGIPINFNYIINHYDKISGEKSRESVITELLESGVTAISVQNDYTALDIIDICNRLEIKIPDQLSIIGFDNVPQSEYTKPSLTTAEQDFAAIGRSAAEAVIAQIEKKHCEPELIVPVKIIERHSIKILNKI